MCMAYQKITTEILQQRLFKFAQRCQQLIITLSRTTYNIEYGSQFIRSSASPGLII